MPQPTRVALALGSGGARGYAHIGVIQVLEERGYEIVSVAGSSMGAAVGGLYAAGALPEYTDWVRTLTQRDVLRLLDPRIRAPGAIQAEKIMQRVSELLGGARIEDLPIAYTAVATDLIAHREVWFQNGPVDVAIRASIALPSFITPVMLNGRLLADGGLLNPVPLAPTSAARADLTIAVSLSGDGTTPASLAPERESAEVQPAEDWFDRFRRTASGVLDRDVVRMVTRRFSSGKSPDPVDAAGQGVEDVFGELPSGLRMFDVMQLSLEAMQSLVASYRMAAYPPDVYVTVPKDSARVLDFHRAEELISLGRERAVAALDAAAANGAPAPNGNGAPASDGAGDGAPASDGDAS
ncbi:patatin-like phospholipase family protein [Agromyces sp. Marseille-P2726]|uniref:patatin-like phospholipase family protein n=1 Tax=Agromyces sp. Marseille-P2726 TaxID=2709132 RepID=UPI00156D4AFE|nr:patatin-like phospholipase family protein [Agromyces sp. Marseille-P2726]